jgi:hypothetical protein
VQFPFPDILDFIVSDKKKKCKLKKKIGGGEKMMVEAGECEKNMEKL